MPMMAAVSHAFVFPAMQSMIAAKARVMNISERRESALTIEWRSCSTADAIAGLSIENIATASWGYPA